MVDNLGDCQLGLATQKDSEGILELINLIYADSPWTLEHLDWQHFSADIGPSNLYVVRENVGRIVSMYASVPKQLRLGKSHRTAYMVQDVMTHPDYRRRGFLHLLARRCFDDLHRENAIGFTFPNKFSEHSFERTGWTELMTVPYRVLKIGDAVARRSSASKVSPVTEPFTSTEESIWRESGLHIGVARTVNALNWRYSRPETTYHRFLTRNGEGFLVSKVFDGLDGPIVHICDLVVRQNAIETVVDLLDCAKQFTVDAGATLLTAWLAKGHAYAEMYDAMGLTIDAAHNRCVFITGPENIFREISVASNWHFSQGDSDVY